MNSKAFRCALLLAASAAGSSEVQADSRVSAARELAEWSLKKFAGKAVVESTEAFTRRIVTASSRYGDDLVRAAIRKAGPKALSLADEAVEHAPHVLRFVGKYGNEGASLLTRRSMKLLALGDEAAEILIKHKGVAEPLLEGFGKTAAQTLGRVSTRNGRRLAMLKNTLLRAHKAERLLKVITKYGDPAMEWVWKHKGQLATAATLTAFLANPEPFLNGTRDLAELTANSVLVPVAGKAMDAGVKVAQSALSSTVTPLASELSREVARSVPWKTVGVAVCLCSTLATTRILRFRRRKPMARTT